MLKIQTNYGVPILKLLLEFKLAEYNILSEHSIPSEF